MGYSYHSRICNWLHWLQPRSLLAFVLVLFWSMCSAATFTQNGGTGTSTIGNLPGCDYATIADAADDFTSSAQPVTGNYSFVLVTHTTVTRQIAFGKNTNGHTISLTRQGDGGLVDIGYATQNNGSSSTFDQTQGCPGQIIIGLRDLSNTATAMETGFVATDNFVIDGLNVQLSSGSHFTNSRVIHILGSSNCIVRNCRINNECDGSPPFGIYVTSHRIPVSNAVPAMAVHVPTGTIIENNYITVENRGTGRAIAFNGLYDGQITAIGANAMPPGTAPSNFQIKNNEMLRGRSNAIYLNYADSGLVENNVIFAADSSSGICTGILHNTARANGWTLTIRSNRLLGATSNPITPTAFGVAGMVLGPNGVDQQSGTYHVYNNAIYGLGDNATTNNPHNGILARSNASNYHIQHNSVVIFQGSNLTSSGDNAAAIAITSAARTTATTILRNNLVYTHFHGGYGLSYGTTGTSTLVTDGNNVYTAPPTSGPTPVFGRVAGVVMPTLSDWQTATGQEALGQTVNPYTTTGSQWFASMVFEPGNVRPTELAGGVPTTITGITTDWENDARNTNAPLPGWDEAGSISAILNWSGY